MTSPSLPQPDLVQQFLNEESVDAPGPTEQDYDKAMLQLIRMLEGPQPDSPFTQEKQVKLYHLLWEIRGHIDALYEPCLHAGQLRTWKFLDRAQSELFGELPLGERAMASARKAIQDLPDGPRKQAILFRRPKGVRREQ